MEFKSAYISKRDDVLRLVPQSAQKVLDIGCSTGTLGADIKRRNQAEVVGIEYDQTMAQVANQQLDRVIQGDIETIELDRILQPDYFDCIIFADLLEHLRDPWTVLQRSIQFLKPDGYVVTSIPNISHITAIADILFRDYWPYRARGIHDRTHLRFFTLTNIQEMFGDAGLTIETVHRNYRLFDRPHRINNVAHLLAWPPLRNKLTYQYILSARNTPQVRV
ncbi:MAG: class I SAM-dependent methyltransferase [Caldilineaceae bacterium]